MLQPSSISGTEAAARAAVFVCRLIASHKLTVRYCHGLFYLLPTYAGGGIAYPKNQCLRIHRQQPVLANVRSLQVAQRSVDKGVLRARKKPSSPFLSYLRTNEPFFRTTVAA